MGTMHELNEKRKRLGFSQKSVAESMGVTAPVLSRAVRGGIRHRLLPGVIRMRLTRFRGTPRLSR